MRNESMKYSVLLPVYKGDFPVFLKIAIDSMLCQTFPPDEIVIAVDGLIDHSLESIINEYQEKHPNLFSVYYHAVNEGLGKLLNKTLPLCRNEYIARMDADDYSVPMRIEKQFEVIKNNPEIDVVGCNVDEFYGHPDNIIAHVILPEHPENINIYAKKRCPVRHPTLLYRKSDVVRIGNYSVQNYIQNYVQDYDLVVRMIQNNLKIYNIQQAMVLMRTSEDFYKRRGGLYYLKCIYVAKKEFLKTGFLSLNDFIISFFGHAIVILMPAKMRDYIYKKFLRR